MYWDEIAEECERRVMAELATIYRPAQVHQTAAWKKAIIDVLSDNAKLLRARGARTTDRFGPRRVRG